MLPMCSSSAPQDATRASPRLDRDMTQSTGRCCRSSVFRRVCDALSGSLSVQGLLLPSAIRNLANTLRALHLQCLQTSTLRSALVPLFTVRLTMHKQTLFFDAAVEACRTKVCTGSPVSMDCFEAFGRRQLSESATPCSSGVVTCTRESCGHQLSGDITGDGDSDEEETTPTEHATRCPLAVVPSFFLVSEARASRLVG